MDRFRICHYKTFFFFLVNLISLFVLFRFLFCFLDGHHLWETEAKVERDAAKPVSDTQDTFVMTNLVKFQDEREDETAVPNIFY